MNKWLALFLAFTVSAPLIWYNFRDFFIEVDRARSAKRDHEQDEPQSGFLEEKLNSWFSGIKFLWQIVFPLFVFWLVYMVLSSVNW